MSTTEQTTEASKRNSIDLILQERLAQRALVGEQREVKSLPSGFTDFSSNDYLGLVNNKSLFLETKKLLLNTTDSKIGATGSRLISGETEAVHHFERELATFYGTEAALIFSTGFDANIGLLSVVGASSDVHIFYDEQVHASIRDGLRLARASASKFSHNDLEDLKNQLALCKKTPLIYVEALYSMDGDLPPLKALTDLGKTYGAQIIVDEAHSSGIYGENGEGYSISQGLGDQTYARIHTWGKAHGCQGAVVVGSAVLRESLINFARSFIYTTGICTPNIFAAKASYALIQSAQEERAQLFANIHHFTQRAKEFPHTCLNVSMNSPIHSFYFSDTDMLRNFTDKLKESKVFAVPIYAPTVPAGKERVRISLHSYNTYQEIDLLFSLLKDFSCR